MNERPDHPPETATDTDAVVSGSGGASADLDRIERDLAGVETALERLDAGTYWTDEISGDPIPDDLLIADPVARRTT